jgi:hypothetical protein
MRAGPAGTSLETGATDPYASLEYPKAARARARTAGLPALFGGASLRSLAAARRSLLVDGLLRQVVQVLGAMDDAIRCGWWRYLIRADRFRYVGLRLPSAIGRGFDGIVEFGVGFHGLSIAYRPSQRREREPETLAHPFRTHYKKRLPPIAPMRDPQPAAVRINRRNTPGDLRPRGNPLPRGLALPAATLGE